MFIRLWDAPYNGGWIWFSKENLSRFDAGWIKDDGVLWWAIFGFSGRIAIRTWPWSGIFRRNTK